MLESGYDRFDNFCGAKNKQGGDIQYTDKPVIVSEADAITFPNKRTLADVDGDLDVDMLLPGGYFCVRCCSQSWAGG